MPVLDMNDREHQREAERRRNPPLPQVLAKRQMQRLADQHVLGVADQGRRGPDIGGRRERDQERKRVQAPPRARVHDHRRHGQADDVVREQRRQDPRDRDDRREQGAGPQVGGRDGPHDHRVESPEPQLGRNDHQPEQERHRAHVNGLNRLFEAHIPQDHQRERSGQRDSGAVQHQPRNAADHHPEIDGAEHDRDRQVHRELHAPRSGSQPETRLRIIELADPLGLLRGEFLRFSHRDLTRGDRPDYSERGNWR